MFGTNRRPVESAHGKVQTLIGEGTALKGSIRSDGVVRIDGYLEGTIENACELIIGPKGRVVAAVAAENLSLAGELHGEVLVTGKLELLPGSRLVGNIQCDHLIVHDGATFHGQSRMAERMWHEEPPLAPEDQPVA